ncbi:hypothetical protein [Brevibacillus daliensis]|uniref:hypothetical protein n=1 Tax=Brevibacillus daliensis TaxID=2892995 RepID=UPI001E4A54D5|nr:hypothetical protein [Brevibacillus daliensis]
MNKNLQSFSIIFLGICILLSSWFISQSLRSTNQQVNSTSNEQFRYEFISPNESNIIIFDKQTGEYWRKYIESNQGPTNWEKGNSPISTPSN